MCPWETGGLIYNYMNYEPKHPSEMTPEELEEREIGRRYSGGFTTDVVPHEEPPQIVDGTYEYWQFSGETLPTGEKVYIPFNNI